MTDHSQPAIRYLIFDLDGTLVDSALDFDLMRQEMGLAAGTPILETLATLDPVASRRGWEIVERHELAGAERASPFVGVPQFLTTLANSGIRHAVLTRNSRKVAEAMLRRVPFKFDLVMTRDDGLIKPDPQSIWKICEFWNAKPSETAIIGDSRFDIETGRRAGIFNVLYAAGRDVNTLDYASWAHYVLQSFLEVEKFLAWLKQPA